MSGDTTGKTSKREPRTDWRRLRGMTDEEVHAAAIADPEIRPTDETFWNTARVVIPQSKATHSDMRFKRAVQRICSETCWLYRYQNAIDKLRDVEAVGTDFFRVSQTALFDAQLIRLIRLLEESGRVASFWYLRRCNKQIVDAAIERTRLDLNELKAIAGKLRTIRDKTFVHIDKEGVFDPQELYREADLKTDRIAWVCLQMWDTMKKIYHFTYGREFQYDEYNGDDIRLLAKSRDTVQS